MEDISVDIDDVVEIWELADMYHQLEGLKFSCMGCMGSLERGLCADSPLRLLEEAKKRS